MSENDSPQIAEEEQSVDVNRRSVLQTLAGSAATVGAIGTSAETVSAHHNEDPDYKYDVTSTHCYQDEKIHKGLEIDTWYRGTDPDTHKHKFVTAVGSSSIAEHDGGTAYNISDAELQLSWTNSYPYKVVQTEPNGYGPGVAFEDTSDPYSSCDICDHTVSAAAGLLAGYVGGTVGGVVWTAGTLLENIVDKTRDKTSDTETFTANMPYHEWSSQFAVVQGHYDWVYEVQLDLEDRVTVTINDTTYGSGGGSVASSVDVSYTVEEFQYEVNEDVTHITNHSDSC